MNIKIVFLGTTCMVPTKERNHASIYLEREGAGILFDCGEGTQRQMKIAGIKPSKINKIFISHWHGDHVLGIPGLMQTMGANDYNKTLKIYGPAGTKKKITNMFGVFVFDNKIDVEVYDIIKDGVLDDSKDYVVEAYKLEHSIETFGFRFIEKDKVNIDQKKVKKIGIPDGPLLGKLQNKQSITFKNKNYSYEELTNTKKGRSIGLISDTGLTKNCFVIAKDADLLISEASHTKTHQEKAEKYYHLTAEQAAQIASQSNANKLILTHFSQRYTSTHELEEEARNVFENTLCAYDFMKIKL
ncbi:ribonuclease Z [Candidatus Woesearchaeota archaeon]|nr:ribonuclease Z [Candidatus Woesearchaeota archaeon]